MLTRNGKNRWALLEFAADVSAGWLDELSAQLEKDAQLPKGAACFIQAYLANKG